MGNGTQMTNFLVYSLLFEQIMSVGMSRYLNHKANNANAYAFVVSNTIQNSVSKSMEFIQGAMKQ